MVMRQDQEDGNIDWYSRSHCQRTTVDNRQGDQCEGSQSLRRRVVRVGGPRQRLLQFYLGQAQLRIEPPPRGPETSSNLSFATG